MKTHFILFFSLVIFGCGNQNNKQTGTTVREDFISIDSTKIHYTQQGEGDTTLLFLPGWCINGTYFSDQLNYFSAKYKVVAMDLPGFGQSTSPRRQQWSIENYANDVDNFIVKMKLKNVILIGHSMCGDVIIETSLKKNPDVIALIGIDNFKKIGEELTDDQMKQYSDFFAGMQKDFKNTSAAYAEQYLFQPSTDSVVRKRVKDDFVKTDPAIAVSTSMQNILYSEMEKDKLAELDQKLYLINSDAQPTDTESLKKYCKSGFDVMYIHATGHYPMIEKPKEFNELLSAILVKIK